MAGLIDPSARAARKSLVFHVMYGHFPDATEEEMIEWREQCARYIDNQEEPWPPLSLQAFRRQQGAEV